MVEIDGSEIFIVLHKHLYHILFLNQTTRNVQDVIGCVLHWRHFLIQLVILDLVSQVWVAPEVVRVVLKQVKCVNLVQVVFYAIVHRVQRNQQIFKAVFILHWKGLKNSSNREIAAIFVYKLFQRVQEN